MEILSRLQSEQPCLRTTTEAVVAFVHCHLLSRGFHNESDVVSASAPSTLETPAAFPVGWNALPDSYSFRYRHEALHGDTLVLKAMPLGRSLLLHTTTLQTGAIQSLDIKLPQHINHRASSVDIDEELQQPPPDDLGSLFRDVNALQRLCDEALVVPWLGTPTTPIVTPASPVRDSPSPLNPLEIHRYPRSPYHEPGLGGFGEVGRSDLDPFAPPNAGAFPAGNLVGPSHPMFGPTRGGLPPRGRGVMYPPRGARFDPFGPTPGSYGYGDPNPDHERRPNTFDDMYM